jgi:mono/diheme cytochrome c family protein
MKRIAIALLASGLALGTVARAAAPSGEAIYTHWCAPCHAPGPGHPGTESLQIKYRGNPVAVLVERTDLTPRVVSTFVRQGVLLMAPFRKTEITDAELAALAAFVAGNAGKAR